MIKTYCNSRGCQSEMFHRLDENRLFYYCMSCGRNYIPFLNVNRHLQNEDGEIIFPSIEDKLRHKELSRNLA